MLLLFILVIVLVVIILTQRNKNEHSQSIKEENTCSENVIVEGEAPYSNYALILGIVSCFTSVFLIGLIFGIMGLVYANKGLNQYNECPQRYMSKSKLEIGKITSIIGIVIVGGMLLFALILSLSMPKF